MSERPLEIRRLRAGYGSRVIVDDVSLSMESGEWFVLMGPNGCGKSTLLDCVVSRLIPTSGDIQIAGHSLFTDALNAKRQLGYGCAPESLPNLLTARQCLEVHAGAKGVDAVGEDILNLAAELRFLPYLESFVDTLSLGTRQKLSVLLSLLGDPKLIVLDEAFNGLDAASALIVKRHLRYRLEHYGASLLLATHSLDIVEHYADRAALLLDGQFKREWRREEIRALASKEAGLEESVAKAIGE